MHKPDGYEVGKLNKNIPWRVLLVSIKAHAVQVTIGTDAVTVADQLTYGQGMGYNGISWYFGSGPAWQIFNGAWQSSTVPADVSDISATTFLANTNTSGNLELGFRLSGGLSAENGVGVDLAFYFLWDQKNNSANVLINGVTSSCGFQNVYNDGLSVGAEI